MALMNEWAPATWQMTTVILFLQFVTNILPYVEINDLQGQINHYGFHVIHVVLNLTSLLLRENPRKLSEKYRRYRRWKNIIWITS